MSAPIAARMRSTSSPTSSALADTFTAASAPRDVATDSRCSSTSTITMRGAPKARAASSVTRPMGPAPMMSTPFSGPTSARRHACTPTLRGSHMAPSSRLTLSGSLKHRSPGCTIWLASEPWTGGVAKNFMSSHRL
uniref:Sdh1 n=1 Tax=Arundo donax TaxID=35708 RepID=A0A0A9E2G7_ARUDO